MCSWDHNSTAEPNAGQMAALPASIRRLLGSACAMKSVRVPPSLLIDPYSQTRAHAQLKHHIKFACTYQEIRPGDVLPSIRALAEQLGVGAGVVRRAYRELCEIGFLAAKGRKHVVVTPGTIAASNADAPIEECRKRCEQLVAWGRENRLSVIALGRLFLKHALALETESPSYFFVDVCRLAAEESAGKVAKAWEINVTGLSIRDFAGFSSDGARRPSAVLVNQFLYEDVMAAAGEIRRSVFPVRMRAQSSLQRRIRRLPTSSRVLLVLADDVSQTGGAVLRHYRQLFGRQWRFDAKAAGSLHELTALVGSRRHDLFLLSPAVWEFTPPRLRRNGLVDRMLDEPDPRSLEETRVAAGVLM